MLKDITLGQYFPMDSKLHKLDSRTKILMMLFAIIAIFMGGIDFSEMKIVLPRLFGEPVLDEAGNEILNTLNYGNFISAIINFIILALVVFFLVRSLNKMAEMGKKKEEEAAAAEPPAPPAPSAEELLLTEIRDLLKEK